MKRLLCLLLAMSSILTSEAQVIDTTLNRVSDRPLQF